MWGAYKLGGKAILGGARAGAQLGEGLATQWALHAAGRGARRGLLAPGDPTPPPTAPTDYFDYRGVATWREAQPLSDGQFPVGAFADLAKRKFRGPIGLPGQVMNRHAVIVGPAGSGKTQSLLIPWMYAALDSGWSVVSVDVKGDLLEDFLRFKETFGAGTLGARMTKWDFMNPLQSAPWEFLRELSDDARVDAAVTAILGRREQRSGTDPFFYQRDYRTLRGLLEFARAALPNARTPSDLLRALEDDMKLDAAVKQHPRAPGVADLQSVLRYPEAEYPKVISGVVAALAPLTGAGISAVMRSAPSRPSLDLEHVLDDHHLLIVSAPLRGGQVSETLSSLLMNQLKQRLYERFGQKRRPTLIVIDEAPQISDRVDLAQLLEVSRSAGAGVVLAMQDVAQIKDENERSSILSNAAAFAILPGASPKSVGEFSNRLGQRFERTVDLNVGGRGGFGGSQTSQNYRTESVPVLREREIMQPPVGERAALLHVKAAELGITPKPLLVEMHREMT
jgi:type IV secretory pathway TraG/TraD family ATPase VirD4